VDFPHVAANRFPERHLPAVHGPERFRGGCAFGADLDASRTLPLGSCLTREVFACQTHLVNGAARRYAAIWVLLASMLDFFILFFRCGALVDSDFDFIIEVGMILEERDEQRLRN
jgi:hypothetical protein